MPAIKNQVNGTNYNNNNMFIQYYRFYTWCYRYEYNTKQRKLSKYKYN